jgi:FMN reductase
MTAVVVLSGNPRPGSRTLKLAVAVGDTLGEVGTVVDIGELGAGLLDPDDRATAEAVAAIRGAAKLVVATPTYKGSYTGVLKVLLDRLPTGGLEGIAAVPVVTAGIRPQAEAAAGILVALLRELGASVATPVLATEPELVDIPGVAARHAASVA